MSKKMTSFFSGSLMKQTCKENLLLCIVILLVMCLMANVTNYAMSIMATEKKESLDETVQEDFYLYLSAIALYNEATGSNLSYRDFLSSEDRAVYEEIFNRYNTVQDENELTLAGLENVVTEIEAADVDVEIYIRQFEYAYALAGENGCFSGEELAPDDFVDVILNASGIAAEDMERMQELDFTTFFNKIYFTVIGMLPTLVLVIIVANSLIAAQVDKGSMAYILSTPTRRSAVMITQALFLIFAPLLLLAVAFLVRCASTMLLFGEVQVAQTAMLFLGMYLVTEAAAGICYFCSCIFNQSTKSLAIGGGITLWFFLAALLGMFGSEDLVNMGIGADALGIFNKLTILGLFDAKAVQTIGSSAVDTGFLPGMILLALIALTGYMVGAIKFCKRDLPL